MKIRSVSCVIPCYNSQSTILKCLESVLNQTYVPLEILLIDGGSSDETLFLANSVLKESFIQYTVITQDKNYFPGVAGARQQGVESAKGEYIAFLDADDEWLPEKTELQLSLMQKTGAKFTSTGVTYYYPTKEEHVPYIPDFAEFDYDNYFVYRGIVTSTVIMRKSLALKVIKYDNLEFAEDLNCWLSAFKLGEKCVVLHLPLAIYRVYGSSRSFKIIQHVLSVLRIYIDHNGILCGLVTFLKFLKNNFRRKIKMYTKGML